MVKLNKIYTRTGDQGTAGLVDGSRVSKASLRMAAIGDVDEANAAIGVAIAALDEGDTARQLLTIQNDLFDLGADLCMPGVDGDRLRVTEVYTKRLEGWLDRVLEHQEPLKSFVLPGGTPPAAWLSTRACCRWRSPEHRQERIRKSPSTPRGALPRAQI